MSLRDMFVRLSDQDTIAAYVEAHGRVHRDVIKDYMEEMYDADPRLISNTIWKTAQAGKIEQDGDYYEYTGADWL